MKQNRFGYWRIFWVLLAVYVFFAALGILVLSITPFPNKDQLDFNKFLGWSYLSSQAASFLFFTFFYFFTLNQYYRLIAERKGVASFLRPTLIAMLAVGIYYAINHFLIDPEQLMIGINDKMLKANKAFGLFFFAYGFMTLFFIGVSLLIAYLTFLRDEKKQRKILEEQKMQLEVEKSQANFNFLKAQINPHFLHNTLNFLYAKSLPLSAELSEGILTLSDIMRYALSEQNTRDGKAPLKDEIEHVRNVIKIQQLRFSNNLNVDLTVEGVLNGETIIPFVLITLVENAFKHGDLKSSAHPIVIKLVVDNHRLTFSCVNRKKAGPKELSTGIGLDNIKKRLELAYGKNYQFHVKDDAEFYTTELIIDPL